MGEREGKGEKKERKAKTPRKQGHGEEQTTKGQEHAQKKEREEKEEEEEKKGQGRGASPAMGAWCETNTSRLHPLSNNSCSSGATVARMSGRKTLCVRMSLRVRVCYMVGLG